MKNQNNDAKLNQLWNGLLQQDSLLQSYRSFHLTFQSIFLAIASILCTTIITNPNLSISLYLYALLLIISGISLINLFSIKKVILSRGRDVSVFQKRIISLENEDKEMPSKLEDKILTSFKAYQKFNRSGIHDFFEFIQEFQLKEGHIEELVDEGLGHTRKVLDKQLFVGFLIIWISINAISLVNIIYKNI